MADLVVEPAGRGMLGQPQCPVPERGGLESELDGLAAYRLAVDGVQVLQENPPGHPIHHEVVHCQEKNRTLPGTEIEQHRLQQRPAAQVKARVHLGDHLIHRSVPIRVDDLGQVVPLENLTVLDRRVELVPATVTELEPHT